MRTLRNGWWDGVLGNCKPRRRYTIGTSGTDGLLFEQPTSGVFLLTESTVFLCCTALFCRGSRFAECNVLFLLFGRKVTAARNELSQSVSPLWFTFVYRIASLLYYDFIRLYRHTQRTIRGESWMSPETNVFCLAAISVNSYQLRLYSFDSRKLKPDNALCQWTGNCLL